MTTEFVTSCRLASHSLFSLGSSSFDRHGGLGVDHHRSGTAILPASCAGRTLLFEAAPAPYEHNVSVLDYARSQQGRWAHL